MFINVRDSFPKTPRPLIEMFTNLTCLKFSLCFVISSEYLVFLRMAFFSRLDSYPAVSSTMYKVSFENDNSKSGQLMDY